MSKFIVLGVLFFGIFISINKVEAFVNQAYTFKDLNAAPHNFFDPREEQSPDGTNKEPIPAENTD
jgi:hypothetical protein